MFFTNSLDAGRSRILFMASRLSSGETVFIAGDFFQIWGSTPEPPKFPLPQFQSCNQCIQVHDFIATMKGVMPVQQNVLPGYR